MFNRVVGDPFDEVNHGPQINDEQFSKVLSYIDSGNEQGVSFLPLRQDRECLFSGADLVCGGRRIGDKGYYIEPTIFANVKDEMKIAREEIFGPVQSILKFTDTADVRLSSSPCRKSPGCCIGDQTG